MRSPSFFMAGFLLIIVTAGWVQGDDLTRLITVNGTAVKKVVPDVIVWSLSVETRDMDLDKAVAENAASVKELNELRKTLPNPTTGDFQTGYMNIRKIYRRDNRGNEEEFRYFQVTRSITMRQKTISKFDEVLGKLSRMPNVQASYGLVSSEMLQHRFDTRLDAVKIAKKKAERMTAVLGAKVGRVMTIMENQPSNQWNANPMSNSMIVSSGASSPADSEDGTFAPGAIEVRVSVKVEFEILSQ